MKRTTHKTRAIALPFLVLLIASCDELPGNGPQETPPAHAVAPDGEGPAGHTAEAREEGQDPTQTDLDRPVEELFSATCEHKKKTFECDECRAGVGVVRAPASLFEGGLLKTEKAVRERIEIPLVLTGEVRFDERRVTHLSTQAEGIVRKVHVALGDKVGKDQALVEIESVVIGEAEGAYLEAQAALRLARRNYERVAKLRKEAISSEKEYLQSKQEFEAAEIRVESAVGKLTRFGMSTSDANALSQASAMGSLVLRAPADGTMLSLHAVPGEVARIDQPLAIVGDNTTVWVWADLYERDVARVAREQQVKKLAAAVAVKAYPGEEFPGTVDFISPSMEEASRTVRLRVEVKNPAGRLLAGMFANVKVSLPGEEEAIALSKSAVLEDEGRSFVFMHHHDDYYVRRPVAAGRSWGARIEVVEGLGGGETVVADGSFLMKSDVLRSKMGAGCAD